jgi:serine/threonine protein kinase/Flp pilus assembly protein TadD
MISKTISHYRIVEELGVGGMGVVYKAEDLRVKRPVALKFLPPELTRDKETREPFIQDALAASALDHPNICTINEIDETEDGQLFICMPYYEGEILKKKIESSIMSVAESLEIAVQVAEGLDEVHKQGIVHRDVKPSNIMVTSDGVAKLLDFGLSKLVGQARLTLPGTTLGTVAYMSPEMARGETVDHRADIWSLGVMLYEMVAGKLPFKGEYETAMINSILNAEPEPIATLRTELPIGLDKVISKALTKSPDYRYQHASEILSDLKQLQKTVKKRKPKPIPVKEKPRKRRWLASPMLWALITVLALVAVGLMVFYPARAIPFKEGDWILITDFENLTGEEVFDKSLNTALSVSIEQSSYINVLPRRRINDVLRQMKKEDTELIDEAVGREIAVREGIKVILVPNIGRVGDTYVLSGAIKDTSTGDSFKSEIVRSQGDDKVLDALDELTERIRKDLGESLASISKQSKPLAQVTTSSLDALKQYSLAIENQREAKFEEARIYYENALRVDPAFTAAKASLGQLNFDYFDREEGERLLVEAIEEADNLTEREDYEILAFYAASVKNRPQEAIEHLKVLLGLYPYDSAAHNKLGLQYEQIGSYQDAVAEFTEAIRIDPYLMLAYNNLNNVYLLRLGDWDSAIYWARRQLYYNDRHVWAYDKLGWAYLGKDEFEQAQAAFEKAIEIDPRFILGLYRLGHTLRLQGRYADAVESIKKILEINPEEYEAYYQLGILYQLMEDDESARLHFENYLRQTERRVEDNPDHAYSHISLALVLTRLGEEKVGWSIGQKGIELDPDDNFAIAQLLSVQGKIQEAIEQLELLVEKGYRNYVRIKIHPDFQPLYVEPRFYELISGGLKQ